MAIDRLRQVLPQRSLALAENRTPARIDRHPAGLVFGVPGLAAVGAGVVAGRFIGRFGSRTVLAVSMSVQGLATLPLVSSREDC